MKYGRPLIRPTKMPDWGIAAALAVVLIFILVLRVDRITVDHPVFAAGGDHLSYHAMASGQTGNIGAPFCYRVLIPGLVKILPLSVESGFYLQTLAFLWATGIVLFLVLRELGENRFFAWTGIVLFYGLNWAGKFTLWNFWLTDPALFFFGISAFYAILKNKTLSLVLIVTLGVLAKESMIFILPLYYGYQARKFLDWRVAGTTLLIGLIPLGLILTMRIIISSPNQIEPLELFRQIGIPRLTKNLKWTILGGTVGTWGILIFILALLGLRHQRGLGRAAIFFLPVVYIQPLFAINRDRLLVFGFILVIPLAVAGMRWIATRYKLSRWMTIGFVTLPFLFLLLKNDFRPASLKLQLMLLAFWSAVVFFAGWMKSRPVSAET
ncbi:MAG: hypothetical protein KAH56_01855 [Candidatus Krumholzibacteria bacterium]|nr:hypothetical protein [Candidatus Krumholzibacteria bacterium]